MLNNELVDCRAEDTALDQRLAAAMTVTAHLDNEEANVLAQMQQLQVQLNMIQQQRENQESKLQQVQTDRDMAAQRREMIVATIEPLQQEVEKLELLINGLHDLHGV